MDRKALAEHIFIHAVAGSNEMTGPVLDPATLESIAHKSLGAAKIFERAWAQSVGLTAKTDQGGEVTRHQ
jgi:hypothetical protein